MTNKEMIFLIIVCVCSIVFTIFMSGRVYEQINQFSTISYEAEKHKQRFYDEGYTAGRAEAYERGFNDALDVITLLNLEISLGTERKTFGEMADICRERFGVAK